MILLLDLIFPARCPFCGKPIESNQYSCCNCLSEHKIAFLQNKFSFCDSSFVCFSPFIYADKIKESIWKFKFRGRKEYSKAFACAINKILPYDPSSKEDYITSVPLSQKRMRSRGYNQTELFAKRLAKMRKTKYKRLLTKTKDNLEQHTLSLKDRQTNVLNVYSALKSDIIEGSKILLCDDIITTGNTLGECRKVLLNKGAKEVICATIAVVKEYKKED